MVSRFLVMILLILDISTVHGETPQYQLRWCHQGATHCSHSYTPGPSFFKRSSCDFSLRFLKRQRGHLEGHCVNLKSKKPKQSVPHPPV